MGYIRFLKKAETEYSKMKNALEAVYETGYGIVSPSADEMTVEEPEMFRQGGQYGIRIRATAPSLHIVKVDVGTEVSPVIGSEQQSGEYIETLLGKYENDKEGLLSTNIFGKTLSELMADGLHGKGESMPEEAKVKMRRTITKIVNEGKGGVLCLSLIHISEPTRRS